MKTKPTHRPHYLTLLCALLISQLLFVTPAAAHAEFVAAIPAPGQIVVESPSQIEITFSESLGEGSTFIMFDTNFTQIPIPVTRPAGEQARLISAEVPPLTNGTYTVQWLAISTDGHPISGSYEFTVGGNMLESIALAEGVSYNPPDAFAWIMVILAIALPAAAYYWQKGQRP